MTMIGERSSAAHSCAVPVSDEQLFEMTAAFLSEGLAVGERVVYFDHGTGADAILDRLADDRVPLERPLAIGQLTIVPSDVTRSAMRSPVERVEQMLRTQIDATLSEGYPGFRMAHQAGSALREAGGMSLAEYDAGLDRVLRSRPRSRALCLYDRGRHPEHVIERLRALHGHELAAPAVYDDGLLRVTRIVPSALRLAGEVDHSNRPILERLVGTALDEALRSHSAPPDITLNLASLRFLDVGAAVRLVHAAEAFPSAHRLVLDGVRPRVQRVLDRCGAPFAAQLVVLPRHDAEPGR
jgi:anti-anti-sigma regulatory factor